MTETTTETNVHEEALKGIKKTMVAMFTLLLDNPGKKVSSIMGEATVLCSAKGRAKADGTGMSSTFIKDAAGDTVAVFDYYFKRWMPLVGDAVVEFGKKASAASGYNSMSKDGVSHWTKQQRVAKTALSDILVQVEAGELAPSDIGQAKEAIELARKEIVETADGFETHDKIVAYLADAGITLEEAE